MILYCCAHRKGDDIVLLCSQEGGCYCTAVLTGRGMLLYYCAHRKGEMLLSNN
jgi:hypothetical protein